MHDLCVVLGNGPSLKGFDLTRLNPVATLGMNAAYRYWDQIDWYPTYYACLDDQLIITHHDQIYRLWQEKRIRQFFLHGTFFDHHPDCINAPRFFSLDQALPHWYRKRGMAQGWPALHDTPAFKTTDTTKVTTGAFATRFAAHMGHRTLAIMGVDLKYVEILPEAEKAGGVTLVMRETPKTNPNYFFDSYQQAGDKFNIPNPDAHNNALHIQSFRLVAQDFVQTGQPTRVFNTNPNSLLEETGTFPLVSIDRILDPAGVDAVVVPTNRFEIPAILDNFRIWALPSHAPFAPDELAAGITRRPLVLVFNNDSGIDHEAELRQAYAAAGMDRFFSGLDFRWLYLSGRNDRYQRDYSQKVGDEGYKSGPNNQFFLTMREAATLGRNVFMMETDCVPLRAGWLSALDRAARAAAPFWILGSRYQGVETLSPSFAGHLNGNAVYAAGDPEFQEFLSGFWEPRTRALVAEVDRRLAYDCILEKLFTDSRSEPDVAAAYDQAKPRLCETTVVLNISGRRDLEDTTADYEAATLARFPDAFVLHNRSAHKLLAARSRPMRPRILVLDMTAMGNGTATGEIKANLLNGWPQDRLLQIAAPGPGRLSVVRPAETGYAVTEADETAARAAIEAFVPEVILYRPLADAPHLHDLAMSVIDARALPLVTWIMDDWPARLQAEDPERFAELDADLRRLLARSALRLSISESMSVAFAARYGQQFEALANGVDPARWAAPRKHQAGPVTVRYAGGLAPDMNAASIQRIAQAVEQMAEAGQPIHFEINTRAWWKDQSGALFAGFKATKLDTRTRSFADYVQWLCDADVTVIGYNFDEASLRYVRYSLANKMPECLASGAAILAHGPRGVATIDYLADRGAAAIVDQPEVSAVVAALDGLLSPDKRIGLARVSRSLAFERHSLSALADRLTAAIAGLLTPPAPANVAGEGFALPAGSGVWSDAPGPAEPGSADPGDTAPVATDPVEPGSAEIKISPPLPAVPLDPLPQLYLFQAGERLLPGPAALDAAKPILARTGVTGLILFSDPRLILASHMASGGDPLETLAFWLSGMTDAMALHRQNRARLVLADQSEAQAMPAALHTALAEKAGGPEPGPVDLPATAPADPVLWSLADHVLRASPPAVRLLAEARASAVKLAALSVGAGPDPVAPALAAYRALVHSRQAAEAALAATRSESEAALAATRSGSEAALASLRAEAAAALAKAQADAATVLIQTRASATAAVAQANAAGDVARKAAEARVTALTDDLSALRARNDQATTVLAAREAALAEHARRLTDMTRRYGELQTDSAGMVKLLQLELEQLRATATTYHSEADAAHARVAGLERARKSGEAKLAELEAELRDRTAEDRASHADALEQAQEQAALTEAALREDLGRAHQDQSRLRQEIERISQQTRDLEQALSVANADLARIYASHSWAITRPMRDIRRFFGARPRP